MSADTQLRSAFATGLGIDVTQVRDDLAYSSIPEWDSIAHLGLVAEIEDVFDVALETDDIIDLSSVAEARRILTKLGVAF
jgi:acyl carrier protein